MNNKNIKTLLKSALEERVLVLDGSMGVMLQRLGLDEAGTRGRRFMTHPYPLAKDFDVLCLTRPEVVVDVHRRYLEAGVDIIETNTFNSNRMSQSHYGLSDYVEEMNIAGARIARDTADRYMQENPDRTVFVAGSIGPSGASASLSSDVNDPSARSVDFNTLSEAFEEQTRGLIKGGVDILLAETVFDMLNAKATLHGIAEAQYKMGSNLPVFISITVSETSGRMLSGHTVEAFVTAITDFKPFAIGINCSAGPSLLSPYLRQLAAVSPVPVIFYPNAGHPDELGQYSCTPDIFAEEIKGLLDEGLVNIVGGCCGTSPDHILRLSQEVKRIMPRKYGNDSSAHGGWLASLESFHDDRGFINVGERCNVAGSRKFLRLIKEKNYDEALAIARKQVDDGAMVLDLNFDDGLLESEEEMVRFLRLLSSDPSTASVPWMIDSSDFKVIESALRNVPGKAIVNSISLKHGEEEFIKEARVIASYGAAVVVMLFDENGQAAEYSRKIEIAARSYSILTEKCGYSPRDIIIDPNVLSIATGMPEHDSYAIDFIRAVDWISKNLPGVKTSGGISNLSFSFRGNNYLRQAMHAVFLYHAIKAGLSMAIIDPASKVTYEDIPEDLLNLLDDVILFRRKDAAERLITAAAGYASLQVKDSGASADTLDDKSVEDRLAHALRTGDDSRLQEDLEEAVGIFGSANAVVEGPLMQGMEIVGKLFEQGKMFLPQVVKSARTMHRAVKILTPYLEKDRKNSAIKGTFIVATVKGDVHDIGKNIVKVVLECNNYNVIDLGVQVEASAIVDAVKKYKPDFIGLSGLIAPSLNEMADVASALERNNISIPLFVGGAATSELHTALKIAPEYPHGVVVRVNDASQNPLFANRFLADADSVIRKVKESQKQLTEEYKNKKDNGQAEVVMARRCSQDWKSGVVSEPSFLGMKVLPEIKIGEVRNYINWIYFLNCWKVQKDTEEASRLLRDAEELLDNLERGGAVMLAEVAFYEAYGDERGIHVGDVFIPTPRQDASPKRDIRMALSDFVAPKDYHDHVGCFCVSIGHYLREEEKKAADADDSYHSLLLQSVCDRLAEATSEYLHMLVRTRLWGYAADEKFDMDKIRRGLYQGIRPAVGYPSLPDQRQMHTLAKLIDYSAIGVEVTENGALFPSSSVSGLYIASEKAVYFTLS